MKFAQNWIKAVEVLFVNLMRVTVTLIAKMLTRP